VGSLDFSVIPLSEAIELLVELTSNTQSVGTAVHFANAYNVALADTDPGYQELLLKGDLVFSDGTPIVWAGRRFYPEQASRWTRVYGPDVMRGVLEQSAANGPRHYLLGGTTTTLALLEKTIAEQWPQAQIVGSESPDFSAPSAQELLERDQRIRDSGASCVWVGLGTPKQDYEVGRLVRSLPVTALAVGAAFDFIAGTVEQAPRWMQRSGLEWTFRLAREPRRLAKRYFWGNPRFIASVVRQRRHS